MKTISTRGSTDDSTRRDWVENSVRISLAERRADRLWAAELKAEKERLSVFGNRHADRLGRIRGAGGHAFYKAPTDDLLLSAGILFEMPGDVTKVCTPEHLAGLVFA